MGSKGENIVSVVPTSQPSPAATAAPGSPPTPASGPSLKPLIAKSETALRQVASFDKQTPIRIEPSVKPEAKSFYFSYDDSASTAGVTLTKQALRENRLPSASWARPWEFLNFERFESVDPRPVGAFKVSMGLWGHADLAHPQDKVYELGVHVTGPETSKETRKPLNLTILADLSGFYTPEAVASSENPRELARTGLEQLVDNLKPGDTLHFVQAGPKPAILLENWNYSREDIFAFTRQVRLLDFNTPNHLKDALAEAYRLALKSFDPHKTNRVLFLTDIATQELPVDLTEISRQTRLNNQEGIYFSAVGFGSFNDKLVNRLTEAGSGAYFAVQSKQDAQRAFKDRFLSLVDIAAKQVEFRLDYPALLKRKESAAEQSSTQAGEVLPTNFSANTSQFFWETFASAKTDIPEQEFKLWILYYDPKIQQHRAESFERTLGSLLNQQQDNIKDAHLIHLLTALMKGDKPKESAQLELDKLFTGHDTAIGKEYKQLIQAWTQLK